MAVTAESVAGWLKIGLPTGDELARLELVIAAVAAHLSAHYVISDPPDAAQDLAAIMLAARLWQRRDSPGGVQGFGEFGPVRVTRVDPDIARMLTPLVVFG